MPACADCGAETPRDEMYGAPDDLRCQACARRRGAVFEAAPVRSEPRTVPIVSCLVMAAAVVCTILKTLDRSSIEPLVEVPEKVWSGEFWRLFTSILPHVDAIHLLFNLYWMWKLGFEVEIWMGSPRYCCFVLLTGMGSLAAEVLVTSASAMGLSGVGYALFGLLYALRRHKDFAAILMPPSVVQMFVGWFFLCIVLTYLNFWHVANVAHGAGALLGWLVGVAVLARRRILSLSGAGLLGVALVVAAVYLPLPWSGPYAIHRGNAYLEKGDYANALYWYRKARDNHWQGEGLSETIRLLEREVKENDRH